MTPTKPTSSQLNRSQPSTRIYFQENLCTYEERHASLYEPLKPATRHAPLSEPKYKPTYNEKHLFQQDPNRTRYPSQNQNQTFKIERQIIHPRRNRYFATPRVHFNIRSSPSPNLLDISSNTTRRTHHHYKRFHNKTPQISNRII